MRGRRVEITDTRGCLVVSITPTGTSTSHSYLRTQQVINQTGTAEREAVERKVVQAKNPWL